MHGPIPQFAAGDVLKDANHAQGPTSLIPADDARPIESPAITAVLGVQALPPPNSARSSMRAMTIKPFSRLFQSNTAKARRKPIDDRYFDHYPFLSSYP
jgi:hypothetical protein